MAKVIALLLSFAYLTSGNDLQELLSVDDCESDTCDLSLRQLRGNLTSQAFEILGIDSTLGILRGFRTCIHTYIHIYIYWCIIKYSNDIYHIQYSCIFYNPIGNIVRFQDIFQFRVKTTNRSCGSIFFPLKPEWEFPKEGGMGQLRLLWMLQSLQAPSKMSVQQWPGRNCSGMVSGIRMLPWKQPKSHVENWVTQRSKIFGIFIPKIGEMIQFDLHPRKN